MGALLESTAEALGAALAWLGRQKTRAIAALVFIGIAFPPIGALLKPFVTEAIFVLLCIASLRVETETLRGYLKRPAIIFFATLWTSLVIPALFGAVCLLIGVDAGSPDLYLALMLQAIASPLMAAPAFAMAMGLDATLVLMALVASTALTPLTATIFAAVMGLEVTLSPLALGLKLFVILAGSALLAFVIRRIVGGDAIVRQKDKIDGFNILVLFVFVAAVMENVAAHFLATPLVMIGLTVFAFAVFLALLVVTTLVFLLTGRERAFALGFMVSQRNMGLMLAATGGSLPDLTWLYFAVSQLPIYLSPQLLKRPAQWIIARGKVHG